MKKVSLYHTLFPFISILSFCLLVLCPACQEPLWEDGNPITQQGSSTSTSLDKEVEQYPVAIDDYVEHHYPHLYIVHVALEDVEEEEIFEVYIVELSEDILLFFDLEGNFLTEEAEVDEEEEEYLSFDDLPEEIIAYLEDEYPEAEVVEIIQEFNGNYEVVLDNGIELYFDEEGEILYEEDEGYYGDDPEEEDIPISELPTAIVDYINSNYPTATIIQADLLTNDGYKVHITDDIELYFDEEGEFVGSETEYRLEFRSITFPDTVKAGESVMMTAYLVNRGLHPFSGDLDIPYDIEDQAPNDFNSVARVGSNIVETIIIPPKDSVLVSFPIFLDHAQVNPQTFDAVIVWPEINRTDNNSPHPFVLGGGHNFIESFVTTQ